LSRIDSIVDEIASFPVRDDMLKGDSPAILFLALLPQRIEMSIYRQRSGAFSRALWTPEERYRVPRIYLETA